MAHAFRFLADAIFTVKHRRFFRMKRKMQLKLLLDGLQILIGALPLNLPIAVPDAAGRCADAGDTRAGAIDSFRMIKLLAIEIAEREMGEINVPDIPS